VKLDAWAESDVPGTALWCDREASCTSVCDLWRFCEVVVAIRLALVVGRGNRCIESKRWRCVERSDDRRPRV
jgi:hypothetical protein